MRRLTLICALALAALTLGASPASAAFGLKDLDVTFTDKDGENLSQAGRHPFAMSTSFAVNTKEDELLGFEIPDQEVKDLFVTQITGLAGNPTATPLCSTLEFLLIVNGESNCPNAAAVGTIDLVVGGPDEEQTSAVYALSPPPGTAAKFGFIALGVPVTIEVAVEPTPPYRLLARPTNISQVVPFYSSELTLWGTPADPAHDTERGHCAGPGGAPCPAGVAPKPFLTLPRACEGPLETLFEAFSWQGSVFAAAIPTHDDLGAPRGFIECEKLGFAPQASVEPTTDAAESPSGLDFELTIEDENLANPEGAVDSDIKRARLVLPEGMTLNPSIAAGLLSCSAAGFAAESIDSAPGQGCPEASKVGTVEAETPILEGRVLKGQLFVATQDDPTTPQPGAENPFDSLIALYMVIREPQLGLLFKLAGRVEPDPLTGQIVTTFGEPGHELPQYPLGQVRVHLREGGRSPLITPPACGTYSAEALFTPWADPGQAHPVPAGFQITKGPGGGPCPPAGAPPFEPGFQAGTLSNAAGAHSPFAMRLTRRDGDQDLTRFDAVLPPGMTAKLAGVPWCPEAAIARARGREGKEELRDPSCPAASQVGSVQGGAGVGSQLTYVPGKVYLAGPTGGAPISVVGIVPAVAGPFDVGTIVVRQALDLDPITGQAKVLSAASDPIPHILAGIPLRVRDIQVSVDRPNFTLNPTNCSPLAVGAGIWGGGTDVFSAHDDFPVLRSARFQAADCGSLGFKPKLAIKLKGGVRRGAHPALRAHVRPRPGDANFSRAVVTLPRSAFLDQAHIRTICTRVQFAAPPGNGAHCPPGARYGYARAWSPLLDEPAQGPVFLRSSDNNLPDLVVALQGPPSAPVQVELSARIDSVKGGIRSTFAGIPDLPVSRFILDMQGGKKGLIVNSRHLCHKPARNRAKANLRGQNGRISRTRPRVIATKCQQRRKKRRKAKRARVSRAPIAD